MILEDTIPAPIPTLTDRLGRRVRLSDARYDKLGELVVRPALGGGGYVAESDFPTLGWAYTPPTSPKHHNRQGVQHDQSIQGL